MSVTSSAVLVTTTSFQATPITQRIMCVPGSRTERHLVVLQQHTAAGLARIGNAMRNAMEPIDSKLPTDCLQGCGLRKQKARRTGLSACFIWGG